MEKISKLEKVTKTTTEEFVVVKYKAFDGKEFDNEEAAIKHEQEVTELREFLESIQFKKVDEIQTFPGKDSISGESHDGTFTFVWDGVQDMSKLSRKIDWIRDTKILEKSLTTEPGRYLVISYSKWICDPNGPDYYEYDGYFGLVSDYVNLLEADIKKAIYLF